MAEDTNNAAPATGPLPDLSDFCRACKANVANEKDIQVVSEWCCACLSKLLKNHHHLCEFNFAASKSQCLHCREGNYSNKGAYRKPCLGPPRKDQAAAAELVDKAQILCTAEFELAELNDKLSRSYKKTEYMAKIVECKKKVSSAEVNFKKAAKDWKEILEQYGNQATQMSCVRFKEDEAAHIPESDMYKKEKAFPVQQSIGTTGIQPDYQQGAKMESARRCLEAIIKVETAADEAMEAARQAGWMHSYNTSIGGNTMGIVNGIQDIENRGHTLRFQVENQINFLSFNSGPMFSGLQGSTWDGSSANIYQEADAENSQGYPM